MEKVTATEITENEPKIEKISLSELRAENEKMNKEQEEKAKAEFDENLRKFLLAYDSLTDREKEIFWNKK